MLRREEAEKRLAKFRNKNWKKERVAAMGKLPAATREAGLALLGHDAKGQPCRDYRKQHQAKKDAVARMQGMSAAQRKLIFAVLFPQIASHLEAAWQMVAELPYEVDYERRGFRAPGVPAILRAARALWLDTLLDNLGGYDQDIVWIASWAPHLDETTGLDELGVLLAAAIDSGGEEGEAVFGVLRESASNEHEVGGMGRHVTRALLTASRPDGWELIEKTLLAAQRQEGLRQVILQTVDEAHPEAFRRLLRLVLDNNLLRFSAVVRAAGVWFGLYYDSLTATMVRKAIEDVLRFLGDSAARTAAIQQETGETLYLALWTIALQDACAALTAARPVLQSQDGERRYVAVHFLNQLKLPDTEPLYVNLLDDPDLRIACAALDGLSGPDQFDQDDENNKASPDLWEPLTRLLDRLPKKRTELPALVWPWAVTRTDREQAAGLLPHALGKRPPSALIPYLSSMSWYGRGEAVDVVLKQKTWGPEVREMIFALVGDRDQWVREKVLAALKKIKVEDADAVRLEAHLSRKGAEVRQAVLTLLRKQKAPAALASADRLLASSKVPQRLAGLELLRALVESKKAVDEACQCAEAYRARHRSLSEEEVNQLDAIQNVEHVVPTLDDALGLLRGLQRTPTVAPRSRKVRFVSAATLACLKALDDLIHEHREVPVRVETYGVKQEVLLGNVGPWSFPRPEAKVPVARDASRLPLREVWEKWLDSRGSSLRDRDGLELIRLLFWLDQGEKDWNTFCRGFRKEWGDFLDLISQGLTPPKLRHPEMVEVIVPWLVRLRPAAGAADFLLDAVETAFTHVPEEVRKRVVNMQDWQKRQRDWRIRSPADAWFVAANRHRMVCPEGWTMEHGVRLWQLMHWRDQPAEGVARYRPNYEVLLAAYEAGKANDADVLDELLQPGEDFDTLSHITEPAPPPEVTRCPALAALVARCCSRILEVELARGELPTAATEPAKAIRCLRGIDTLVRLLGALGNKPFKKDTLFGESRAHVLTHLISVTHPAAGEAGEAFAARMKQEKITGDRLLELSFLAPQWVEHVEHALGWSGLKEGVWWFLAHMPGGRWGVGEEMVDDFDDEDFDLDAEEGGVPQAREQTPWEAALAERTPLTRREIHEGAVDAAWFHRAYVPLGAKRWEALAAAAKYGCSGQGHKKAMLLAEVLLGKAKKKELIAGIRDRQLKDNVRLLGLLPLEEGDRREADLEQRYRVLVDYRRYARKLSPMSREGAVRAADVGVANLARTAGYADPMRLEWGMEARAAADLAAGPISVTCDGITVTLTLGEEGQPDLTVHRGDKPLKTIPAPVKKHPKVAELVERKADLKRQSSRMRQSLEDAMCRGDTFTGAELRRLGEHAVLMPFLGRLILVGEGVAGYPVHAGQALEDHAGKVEPVKPNETLRLAHPHDLYAGGIWHLWQQHLFRAERVQPFKQVFRELYLLTKQERSDGTVSHRYAALQVNPSQAMALWGSRGWITGDGVWKTFHDIGLTVHVSFRSGFLTPLEVEGLTLEGVEFHRRGEWRPIPLAEVPPRLFSEVMRDMDLVVSVAHTGGVDPEASASTVEMRAALLRETCSLLKIDNYRIQKSHVLIDGHYGSYNVHLGSGVVHKQPGGSVCIVPVHSQHRGRLFLPFADDDPRTAEVLSKVLLLARDQEILDPSILEQIR
jgi:hypothetical protein